MSDPVIQISGLRKSFGDQTVLADVSLNVAAGRTLALLGRNGCGKSTTIRMLLGLLTPDGGSIRVADRNPERDAIELRRRVGYLAEDQEMYPWMTPVELCRFLAPFYPDWDQKLADDLLDRFEVPRKTLIARLSKGQSVELGLAVALAHRPPLVILDDPTLGLDPVARKQFNRHLIEHLQAEGRTVLYSSHLLAEVEAVADDVAILDRGRIVRTGSTDDLRQQVQRFVIPADALGDIAAPSGLLDVDSSEEQTAVIVDQSPTFERYLHGLEIPFEVQPLTLDEIYEAFVIGRPRPWPQPELATASV
jgi:ABC-2 type transport system ATP-binding protein